MLVLSFANQYTHLVGKTTVPAFLPTKYTVKTKRPALETTMASDEETTMASDEEFLLTILEDLASVELKQLKWFLSNRMLEEFDPIPKSQLCDADRCETVDILSEFYGTEGALRITAEILKMMGHSGPLNKLLERCHRYTVPPAPKAKTAPKPPHDFLQHFRSQLIQRIVNTRPILQALLEQRVVNDEEIEAITIYAPRTEKNRALVDMVRRKGTSAQEVFYMALHKADPYLLEDLEGHLSPATEEPPKPCSQIMITPEVNEEVNMYRLECPHAGVFHCDVTGLALKGMGEVTYGTIPWDKEFLSMKGKRPAGPMYKFECLKGSFSQLYLPHCETFSDGRCDDLSVVHVTDDKVEFIQPKRITDKHVIIDITGFSNYGIVKDNSPSDSVSPINGMVVMFYQHTNDPDVYPSIHVLLLPRNALIKQVQQEWRTTDGMEYIKVPPDCELIPNQTYTLSGDSTKLIQPEMAKFLNFASYDNYTASFEVQVAQDAKKVELSLKHKREGHWSRRVFFGHEYVEVWRRDVKLNATPPLDTAAGKAELRDLLHHNLKRLRHKDLVTFKGHLTHCEDPLFISDLEPADCMDTADCMVEKYMAGAKDKMVEILRKMDYNHLAEDLRKC